MGRRDREQATPRAALERLPWRQTAIPGPVLSGNGELDAVSASSPSNVWAAGDFADVQMAFVPFVDNWNGTSWQRVPLAGAISNGFVTGIAAVSPNDVWVVANHPPT